ncbi:MAG: ArnT family glycosyltransferase [Phycisphaerae bacterium]
MTQPDLIARRSQRWLLFLIGFAVMLRLLLSLAHPFLFPDSVDYDLLAKAIVHGEAYETNGLLASRMPGYPLFAAGVYFLFGTSIKAVLVVQSLLSAGTIWLVYAIARRIGATAALCAAILASCDPLSIGFSAAFLSEMPFTLLFLFGLWLLLRLMERPSFGKWLLLGFVWGAAVYMRASVLWCIVPVAAWTLYQISWRRRARPAGEPGRSILPHVIGSVLAVVIVFVTLLPWQTRNFSIFHTGFFRLTTLEGISLYEAVYPDADGSPKQDIITLPADMRGLNEAQRNDEWNRRAWHYVRTDPVRIARLAFKKAGRTWSPWLNASEFQNPRLQLVIGAWYLPFFLLSLVGVLLVRFPPGVKILLLIPVGYFTAVHSLFLGSVRYRVPLMPVLAIFAGAAVAELIERVRRRKRPAELTV